MSATVPSLRFVHRCCYLKTNGFDSCHRFVRYISSNIHEVSASGDDKSLSQLLIGKSNVNAHNRHGDTALTLAAEKGQPKVIEVLLHHNANTGIRNFSGHTALELSQLYANKECYDILKEVTVTKPLVNFFDHSPLNRLASKRSNPTWLASTMMSPETIYILFHKSKPIVSHKDDKFSAFKLDTEGVYKYLNPGLANLIFLGVYENLDKNENAQERAWFAVDIHDMKSLLQQYEEEKLDVLPMYPGAMRLGVEDAAIYGQARSLFDWHHRFRYCASCGSETKMEESGYKRVCMNIDCLSHRGIYNTNYPRVDPTVISAIISPDQKQCLLARKKTFPPGMFTCVAGFVEPGESVESACAREIEEEVGITVNRVQYHSSQPWPNPSALMLGCIAYIEKDQNIKLDTEELEVARWFGRDELVSMLCRQHPDKLFVPPHHAIAHQVIKAWCIQTAFTS